MITRCIPIAIFLFVIGESSERVVAGPPLNADTSVGYVGIKSCADCHPKEHESYLDTSHSRSMERVDPDKEVTPASFQHKLSGNDYLVLRKGDKLVHRELIRGTNDVELARTDHEIIYTMGSGTHGKSYVYRDGTFFGQSPLSWYENLKEWAMSPGYDIAHHPGFGRKLSSECFFCHVGIIENKSGNPNDFSILEDSIGCERCHGPGELHVKKYRENPNVTGEDDSIVNPANLKRQLSEAICQQCHLQAAGKAVMAKKDEWDYRPGLPLTDFRIDYQFRLNDDSMRVVGHVEQLHASKCYQESETLTCITCHDPHHTVAAANQVAQYRSICLSCHTDDSCGEPLKKRNKIADNDCAQCHMPAKDTEVPHTAFHHHRIGIHKSKAVSAKPAVGLTAVLDVSNLSAIDRMRCEAIAKFQVAQEQPDNVNFQNYGIESAKALIEVKNQGKSDADATTILAMLASAQGQPSIAMNLANEVVASEPTPSRPRIESLRLLAHLAFRQRNYAEAAKYYRELMQYQSEPFDLFQLGLSEQNTGNSTKAIEALQRTVELAPTHIQAHRSLSVIYRSQGKLAQAKRHSDLADEYAKRFQRLENSNRQ